MQPKRKQGFRLVALAAALIIINSFVFAQAPGAPPQPTNGESSADASRVVPPTQTAPVATNSINASINAKAHAAAINFVPADIFASVTEPKPVPVRFIPPGWHSTAAGTSRTGSDDDNATLAKMLLNPVSNLARISFESNVDFALSADREGYRYTMNLDPTIPFALGKNWNLISRTRLPLIQQDGVVESTVQSGLGDMLQSFYLSPNSSGRGFWGVGTTLLIPTATNESLGTGKFGLGPSVVIGGQTRHWTYGALARHVWSVAGHSDRPDVSATYVEPFLAYTTRSAWTFSLNTESTYDWVGRRWSVPLHVGIAKVLRFRTHPVSVGAALTCWTATVPGGPQACGVRFNLTPLFPAR
jgi:hypothetical protein